MAKAHLRLVTPAIVKRTVTPKRLPNGKLRTHGPPLLLSPL